MVQLMCQRVLRTCGFPENCILVTIVRKSKVLLFDSHFHRFDTTFRWRFNAAFSKDYEHLWQHASETAADFSAPTFDIDDLSPCSIKCMGLRSQDAIICFG